ncbi:RHS repeat-associated core domain-containing protein [Thermoactinomyces mirandus]|uniref:RHS repeat-associated core domain-containing protein n=1 Tax=Thermoactinomyces mirandus TaxID=2756294 RepID=UPI001FEC44A8|nr:RHS repeat-associated core domain-containing protein [Thermoactinomyces mirandus]
MKPTPPAKSSPAYTFDGENRPVSMTKDGQTYYFQLNGQGDVIALTDANGNVVATYCYDAYGRITAHTGTIQSPYLYRGYRYDWETGLYYLQSRYYNPETGRFLTRDTFEGFENEPLSWNKYIYTKNAPVNNVDPNGKGIRNRYAAIIIDIIIAAWGGWQAYLARKAYKRFLRKAYYRLTRTIAHRYAKKKYSRVTIIMGMFFHVALAISGNSVGQIMVKVIDRYVDPRLGYRRNNGRIFG